MKEALRELDFDERTLTPATAVHRISHAKNQMISPAERWSRPRARPREERIASLYRRYEERLRRGGRARLRRPAAAASCGSSRRCPRRSRWYRDRLDPRPGRRVPGHQPRAVPHRAAPHRGAPEPLRGRRSRPVGLPLARRRPAQHPRLREGLPGLPGGRRSSRTTARPSASSRIAAAVIANNTAREGQAALDGERGGRARRSSTARGTRTRRRRSSPQSIRARSATRAATTATSRSSTAPTPSRACSRTRCAARASRT